MGKLEQILENITGRRKQFVMVTFTRKGEQIYQDGIPITKERYREVTGDIHNIPLCVSTTKADREFWDKLDNL